MIISLFLLSNVSYANVLQEAIDRAPAGSTIKLPAGVYKGKITINKPLSIIGQEEGVIIDGEGEGTVIRTKGSFITLKNLQIISSGERTDKLEATVSMVEGKQ